MTKMDWMVIALIVAFGAVATPAMFSPSGTPEAKNPSARVLFVLLAAALVCALVVRYAVEGR